MGEVTLELGDGRPKQAGRLGEGLVETGDRTWVGLDVFDVLASGQDVLQSAVVKVLSQLAAYVRGETKGVESANQLRVAGRSDLAFHPRFGAFAGVSFERNTFAGFRRRFDEIAGVRWKAIVAPFDSLSVDGGGVLTQESDVDGTSKDYPSARLAAVRTTGAIGDPTRPSTNGKKVPLWRRCRGSGHVTARPKLGLVHGTNR